jgi:hypothetical protein
MKIAFSPQRSDASLDLSRHGDVLGINGEPFDFSDLPEGARLSAETLDSWWFAEPVARIDGVLHITLRLPHGPHAPEETRFPRPVTLTTNGPVSLPPHTKKTQKQT